MATNRRSVTSEEQKQVVLDKITEYVEQGFTEAKKLHGIIMQANPALHPRLWYGMPGYAKTKDSAVLCFFRKDALISFGITEAATINQAEAVTASAWYISNLTPAAEQQITETVQSATR